MVLLVIILLAVSVLLPLFHAVRLFRFSAGSKVEWLIVVADSTVFVSLVFLVARWDIAGYGTGLALLSLFAAALLWSLRRHVGRPLWPGAGAMRGHWPTLLTLGLFSAALIHVLSGVVTPTGPRSLAFPLEGGHFVAAQAGGVGLLNHHADHREQRFAVDFTAVNTFGFRAAGLLPDDLDAYDAYAAFGAAIVSPCEGTVTGVRDDLPDLVPPDRDLDNPRGNHVILQCGDLRVELAHLMEGSAEVAVGDAVAEGDALGRVGNSGNTTEPHLHIHAVDTITDRGVPLTFDGRFPVRNSVFRR